MKASDMIRFSLQFSQDAVERFAGDMKDAPMLRSMLPDEEGMQRTIAGLPEQYKLGIPLRKIATAREIANTIVFLASDLASHITMQDLVVDGGATLAA